MRNYIYQICILKCIIPDFPINDEVTQCENPKKIRFRCTRHNNISYMLEYINNINIYKCFKMEIIYFIST